MPFGSVTPSDAAFMLQNQLRLTDGTIVRKDPVENIYSSERGDFYSPHKAVLTDQGWIMRKLKAEISKRTAKSSHGGDYPKLRSYGNNLCHTIIARTWIGPRSQGYEIDHINGNILDWSASNLQYVTPAENRRRARLLRVLRSIGRNPKTMSRADLLDIFKKYDFTNTNPDIIMEREMSRHMEC